MIDLDAYLARIGYSGGRTATIDALKGIMACHPPAIVFENIAVVAGRVPDISLAAIEARLVRGGRGGYCYEQNTLLLAALTQLGFRASILLARVRFRVPATVATPRGHMLLRVDLPDGPWIADAGFGSLTTTAPVALRHHEVQPTPHEPVRLLPCDDGHVLQARLDEGWADLYRFDLAPQLPPDIEVQNWYTATRPNGLFVGNVLATRPIPGGRLTLVNTTLARRRGGGSPERTLIADRDAFAAVLREEFGLVPPATELDAAYAVARRAPEGGSSFI